MKRAALILTILSLSWAATLGATAGLERPDGKVSRARSRAASKKRAVKSRPKAKHHVHPAKVRKPTGNAAQFDTWFMRQRAYPAGLPQDGLYDARTERQALERQLRIFDQATSSQAAAWTPLGPSSVTGAEGVASGRVTAIAIDPKNPSTLYIGAAGGGVWHSADGGATWDARNNGLSNLVSGAIAYDARNGMLYYATGDYGGRTYGGGVFRSPDGGMTWASASGWDAARNKPQFTGGTTSHLVLHPSDPNTLYVARNSGLWRSGDRGDSWTLLLSGDCSDFVIDPANPKRMFAALGYYLGAAQNGVYSSVDGGATWSYTSQLPGGTAVGRISLAMAPTNPAIVYVLAASAQNQQFISLYRLNGTTPTRLSAPGSLFDSEGRGHGYFDNYVAVDPRDASVVYLGGVELWKSTDSGQTFNVLSLSGNTRVVHEDQFDLAFDPVQAGLLYAGNDGGLYKSTDGGQTWTSANSGLAITQLNAVAMNPGDGHSVMAGTQDQGLAVYTASDNWSQLLRGDAGAVAYDATDPHNVYVAKPLIRPMRSSDGGATFVTISNGIDPLDRVAFYPPLAVSPGTQGTLYFGTSKVWVSSNFGNTWTASSTDLSATGYVSAIAVSPVNGTVYAGTSDGRAWALAGGAWRAGTGIPDRWVTSIAPDPKNGAVAYLAVSSFGSGHVFRTTDSGATWADVSGNLPNAPANALAVDSYGSVYVATDVGVFRTSDAVSWTSFNLGLPNAYVTSLSLHAASGTLVAGTYGRGAFQAQAYSPASNTPVIAAGGAVNAFSFQPVLAPGAIATLFGSQLSSGSVAAGSAPYPLSLSGTTITVNGIAAPLLYVSPRQVNFMVPYEVTGTQAGIVIQNPAGAAQVTVPIAPAAPGMLDVVLDGLTGAFVNAAHPAVGGQIVTIFGAGLGAVSPPVATGAAAPLSTFSYVSGHVSCTAGSIPATVLFAGLAPGFGGLYQLNVQLPKPLSSGTTSLVVSVDGRASNAITLTVQ